MSQDHGIRTSQVAAGALAAATAAVLGSTLGMAGTVLGAAIASVVSTIGAALYLRSLQRTTRTVRSVRDRVVSRKGSVTTESAAAASHEPTDSDERVDVPDLQAGAGKGRPRRVWALVTGAVLAFTLGMLVVTGLEWVRGEQLSGGQGTTVGGLVAPRKPSPPPSTTVPQPPAPSGATTTSTPPTTSSTTPPSTTESIPPPTTSSTPETTTPPSTTTPPATSTTPTG